MSDTLANPPAVATPSFKIVRVKKPDGTIVRMKMPIKTRETDTSVKNSKPLAVLPIDTLSDVVAEAKPDPAITQNADTTVLKVASTSMQNTLLTTSEDLAPIPKVQDIAFAGPSNDIPSIIEPAATSSPGSFIRVRKPDGTIVRVRKPVIAPMTSPSPYTTTSAPILPSLLVAPDTSSDPLPPTTSVVSAAPSISQTVNTTISVSNASQTPAMTSPTVGFPVSTNNTVAKNARRGRMVGRLYSALHTAVSLYPSDLISRDGLDHDYDHNHDHDSDADERDDHDDDDSDKESETSKDHEKDEDDLAKATSKIIASGTRTKVIAAEVAVYKPGAEPEVAGAMQPTASDTTVTKQAKQSPVDVSHTHTGLEITAAATSAAPSTRSSPSGMFLSTSPKAAVQVSEREIDFSLKSGTNGHVEKPKGKPPGILGRRTSKLAQGVAWGIALIFPVFFMILGVLNAALDGKPIGAYGKRISELNKIAVSIWPILFGAVVAQSLKIYAAWKVERGIRLVTLEQLTGSHSLASALKQPFFLQTINWTAVALLVLWMLSPLTGQSFVRMQYQTAATNSKVSTIAYIETNAVPSEPVVDLDAPVINAIFGSDLVSGGNNFQDHLDLWDNPKVPKLNEDAGDYPYAAMVGLSISLVPANASTSLSIPYSYFNLECTYSSDASLGAINSSMSRLWDNEETGLEGYYWVGASRDTWIAVSPPSDTATDIGGHLYFAMNYTLVTGAQGGMTTDVQNYHLVFMNCTYASQHVITEVTCTGERSCAVISVAPDESKSPSYPNMTMEFVSEFVDSLGNQDESSDAYNKGSLINRFMYDPSTTFSSSVGFPNVSAVEPAKLEERLQLLLNTYFQIALAPDLMIQNPWTIAQAASLAEGTNYPYITSNTTAKTTYDHPVYGVKWAWLVLLLLSSALLFFAGIVGIILESRTIGPDILGFASSITRDNRYMKVATDSSLQGGVERTRALRNYRVMLQDVRADRPVGRIALGTVEGDGEAQRLRPDRLYQ